MMKDLPEIGNEILREMYAEAEPPLDFDRVLDSPGDADEDFYQNHYLSAEEQHQIFQKYAEKHDLTHKEKASLSMSIFIGFAPTTNSEHISDDE
jgi:hypothetical protein